MTDTPVIWLAAFVTVVVFSYALKDSYIYRLVQHATLGATVGVTVVVTWKQVLLPRWWAPIWAAAQGTAIDPATSRPDYGGLLWLLALIPGLLWYFQLSKKWFWLSTLITGLFVGTAAGLAFKNQILLIMPQLAASIKPLNPFVRPDPALLYGPAWPEPGTPAAWAAALNNALFLAALLATLFYFFFSVRTDHRFLQAPRRFGRLAIMVCLGAMFGSTVMTRMAYLLDRLMFLSHDWWQEQVLVLLPRVWGGG